MSSPPSEPAPAAPAADKPSETEQILKELTAAIDAGNDLTDKPTRVRVCHEIEAKLTVPYGNVTRLVTRALRTAAQKGGAPPDRVKRNLGGADAEVELPPQAPAEPAPSQPSQTPQPQTLDGDDKQQTPGQNKVNYGEVFARCNSLDELRKTPEYIFIRMNYEMAFKQGVFKVYETFGIPVNEDSTKAADQLCDAWAVMHMKHNWQWPASLEKVMLIGGTATVLLLPPLAHFGILDTIKSGKLGKKKDDKKDPPHSDRPL